jgi:hypothetical protein
MENVHLQASLPANREPNFAPLLPLIIEPKSGDFAFHSLVIPPFCADPVSSLSLRHHLLVRHLVGRSDY